MGLPNVNTPEVSTSKHAQQIIDNLKQSHEAVRENLKGVQKRQKRLYDTKLSHTSFHKGDLVYKLDSSTKVGHSKKLRPIFMGPYLVKEVLSPALFRLEGRKKAIVAHHDKLIKCKDRVLPFWIRQKRHQLLETRGQEIDDRELEEIESEGRELEEQEETEAIEEVEEATETDAEVEDMAEIVEEEDGMEEERGFMGNIGLERLFQTRRGRTVRKPGYLKEYVV